MAEKQLTKKDFDKMFWFWFKDRHSILGKFMVKSLLKHHRKGLNNPWIDRF